MRLESERLYILPLDEAQLKLWTVNLVALEKEMGLQYQAEPMSGPFLEIVKGQLKAVQNDAANYLYNTFWFIIRKSDNVVVGSAVFKGPPDDAREVEIGYGIGSNFEHKGYMTEALQTICNWALEQAEIESVIAETDMENCASHKVLERCGFTQYEKEESIWWRLLR